MIRKTMQPVIAILVYIVFRVCKSVMVEVCRMKRNERGCGVLMEGSHEGSYVILMF